MRTFIPVLTNACMAEHCNLQAQKRDTGDTEGCNGTVHGLCGNVVYLARRLQAYGLADINHVLWKFNPYVHEHRRMCCCDHWVKDVYIISGAEIRGSNTRGACSRTGSDYKVMVRKPDGKGSLEDTTHNTVFKMRLRVREHVDWCMCIFFYGYIKISD